MYSVELYAKVRRAVLVDQLSERQAARLFGIHRKTVKKMCQYAAPPGYQRKSQPISPKPAAFTGSYTIVRPVAKATEFRIAAA